MTDATIIQIANSTIGLVGAAMTAWIGYLMARLKSDQQMRATEAIQKEILNTIRAKKDRARIHHATQANGRAIKDLSATTAATHELVNGGAAEQLRQYATMARRLADLTGDPLDVRIAEIANERAIAQSDAVDKLVQAHPAEVAPVKQPAPVVPDPPRVEAGPG